MYFARKLDAFLDSWFADAHRKPLIVKGARQVGKTSSIRVFAKRHFASVIEINFVEHPEYKTILCEGLGVEAVVKQIPIRDRRFGRLGEAGRLISGARERCLIPS